MKIIFTLIIVLSAIGLVLLSRNLSANPLDYNMWNKVKPTDIINSVLTFFLVVITAIYAYTTFQSVKVSKDMAVAMKQANQINFRPYIQIEGVEPSQIASLADGVSKNTSMKPIRGSGFVTALDPSGNEYIIYGLRNLGQVPAKGIKHLLEVYIVDQEDNVENFKIPQASSTGSEILFPQSTSTRMYKLGSGIVIRNDPRTKHIKFKLKVTYHGDLNLDPNTYFYSTTLISKPAPSIEEMKGTVQIEASDEGIEYH